MFLRFAFRNLVKRILWNLKMEIYSEAFLRRKMVESKTGLGRSAIYKLMAKGQFPRPIKLTEKAVGWQTSAIDAWILSRICASKDQG